MNNPKQLVLYRIMPALEDIGFELQGDRTIEDLEEGFIFFHLPNTRYKVLASTFLDEPVEFMHDNIPYYEFRWQDLEQLSYGEMKRKFNAATKLSSLLIPEVPENWGDYIDNNFYFQ